MLVLLSISRTRDTFNFSLVSIFQKKMISCSFWRLDYTEIPKLFQNHYPNPIFSKLKLYLTWKYSKNMLNGSRNDISLYGFRIWALLCSNCLIYVSEPKLSFSFIVGDRMYGETAFGEISSRMCGKIPFGDI